MISPNGQSIYSKRLDPQAKTGSTIGPTICLGPHSRKPPLHSLNHPRNSAIFTKHSCD
jgi:hypothetical protein